MQQVMDYILSLGATVFVPIVLIILGTVMGQGFLRAVRSALTVGVGFIGLNLAISLISERLEPAVQQIIERFGIELSIIDIGSGAAGGIAFSTVIGAIIIPAVLVLNLILLVTRVTKTMNIDIFNFGHYAFTGGVVYIMTDSVPLGLVVALIHATWSLLSADYTQKMVEEEVGLAGVSIPQGYAAATIPLFVMLDKVYDRIPFLRDSKLDLDGLQSKIGMFGDPVIIGAILGVLLSLLAGYNFQESSNLVMGVVGILVLFPRMVRIIVEGLNAIADSAREFFNTRFEGQEVFIGLDSAVTLGLPVTQIVGTILIPITLLLAVILPGNRVLPLGDLAFAAFFICMATIIHKGNILKTLISGIINMILTLYIATWFAPHFTEMTHMSGDVSITGETTALWAGNVFMFINAYIGSFQVVGVIVLLVITLGAIVFVKRSTATKVETE